MFTLLPPSVRVQRFLNRSHFLSNKFIFFKYLATLLTATLLTTSVQGATQGNVGNQSQGSLQITLSVGETVQISGLSDIALQTTGETAPQGESDVCIYVSNGDSYQINTLGDGPGSDFVLTSETGNVPYSVILEDGAGEAELTPGTSLTRAGAGNLDEQNCPHGPNANLIVSVPSEDAATLPSGNYTGTLTVIIAAE